MYLFPPCLLFAFCIFMVYKTRICERFASDKKLKSVLPNKLEAIQFILIFRTPPNLSFASGAHWGTEARMEDSTMFAQLLFGRSS